MTSNTKHIHMIAICGTGMGSLAGLFKQKGFVVTGSDQNTYPPMSSELEALGVKLYQGYRAENLQHPDLVIVGNAVSKDNPEVAEMLRLNIPHLSMPEALSQFFISGSTSPSPQPSPQRGEGAHKESIVVCGTHGKTTISALLSHLLLELGADPSFLYGGVPQTSLPPHPTLSHKGRGNRKNDVECPKNYRMGQGKYFVIEGDEYDTAFFDKGPKFLHYQPYYTIITSLEFDHADIYRDLDHVSSSFEALLKIVNPAGLVLACAHYQRLMHILFNSSAPVITYGLSPSPPHPALSPKGEGINRVPSPSTGEENTKSTLDWSASNISYSNVGTSFEIHHQGKKEIRLTSPLAGEHNVLNVLASFALLKQLGFKNSDIQKALLTFRGVKRRQEVRAIVGDVVVIDDFAHHPTAVKVTIDAVKKQYAGHKIWAIFEPRSNTSRRAFFQKDYVDAFVGADRVIIADVFEKNLPILDQTNVSDAQPLDPRSQKLREAGMTVRGGDDRLDVNKLAADISKRGIPAEHISGVENIVEHLSLKLPPRSVALIMSNGGFGGIHEKLIIRLKDKMDPGLKPPG